MLLADDTQVTSPAEIESARIPAGAVLNPKRPAWLAAAVVFLVAFAVLMTVQGTLFVPASDEGLNLEGAERLLDGQRPYVDFFGHASPGAYLYQAFVFQIAGRSIRTSRALVLGYQSLQIALLFWLVSRWASRRAAWAATWVYAAIETSDTIQLTAHHRWDSSTLGLLSIAMALAGISKGNAWWMAAGAAAALAVVATPTAGLFVLATAGWLCFVKRRALTPYLGGFAVAVLPVIGWMMSEGLFTVGRFGGYFGFLAFMKANYAEANRTPYGYLGGGWLNLLDLRNPDPLGLLVRLPVVLCLALPAVAPLLALGGWVWWTWRGGRDLPVPRGTAGYLIACQVAMIGYSIPRVDVSHLAYTSAFPVALVAVWMAWRLPPKISAGVAMFLVFWSLAFVYQRVSISIGARQFDTPVGTVMVAAGHQPDIKVLLATVRPGDTMFAYPFMPTLGFLTQARNPTSFLFIQPGMMKDPEEQELMADLQRTRPNWILWFRSSRAQFLQAFPGAEKLAYHYPHTEDWIESNYVMRSKLPAIAYDLWELK